MKTEELKSLSEEIMSVPGKARGEAFLSHAEYIRHREGEEGVRKVEEKMEELGYPIKFDETSSLQWIDAGKSGLVIVVAKNIFNWTEDDVFDMGRFEVKVSFFVRLIIQYFISIERAIKEASKHWKRHLDFGSIEVKEYSKEEKRIIIQIKEFDVHPLICSFYAGYFYGIMQLVVNSEKISVKEKKCTHKGDDAHEYLIRWV